MSTSWRDVWSSTVAEIGHDEDAQELHVRWRDGKHSIYSGVPYEKAESVMRSWSVGGSLHEHIKKNYPHRYA